MEDCSEFGNFVITLIITHNLFSKLRKFKLGYDFCTKTMFCSLLSPVVCRGGLMSYLRYLCLFAHSGVQHILCYVIASFVLLRLVYPMFPVSLDWLFLYYPSVFSNVY
jgi:hypothetical protein